MKLFKPLLSKWPAVLSLCLMCHWAVAVGQSGRASLKPGDLYKEYRWTPSLLGTSEPFLRVGGKLDYWAKNSDKADSLGFLEFLGTVDLAQASRAELVVERVQSHEDTKNLKVQINDGPWQLVPAPQSIPKPASDYMFHANATLRVPLGLLRNTVKFRMKVDTAQRWNWPQNLVYGLVLRVYYKHEKASCRTTVEGLEAGGVIGGKVNLGLSSPQMADIEKVEYIGLYEDVDWQGDGVYRQWQYQFHKGELQNNIGSSAEAPFRVSWDTEWLPDQRDAMKVMARVHFKDGLVYDSPAIGGLHLKRSHSVQLVKPYDQPKNWVTREGAMAEKVYLPRALPKGAEVRLYWKSWSPCYSEGITINGQRVPPEEGLPCYRYHEYVQKIQDIGLLRQGENTIATEKTPLHNGEMVHGMEVQWPGIMMKVKVGGER